MTPQIGTITVRLRCHSFLESFEPNTESLLVKGRINTESRVILYYGHGVYHLGDPNYKEDYPYINYSETYQI